MNYVGNKYESLEVISRIDAPNSSVDGFYVCKMANGNQIRFSPEKMKVYDDTHKRKNVEPIQKMVRKNKKKKNVNSEEL